MSATTSTNIMPSIVFYGYLALLMQIRAVIAICFDLTGCQPFKINFYYVLPMLLLLSVRKRTAERRGRQNAWVWQAWRGYYFSVLSEIHLTLMFFARLQKDLFKGVWSLAEGFLKQNYCRACHTRSTVVFPLSSSCVSSLLLLLNTTKLEERLRGSCVIRK